MIKIKRFQILKDTYIIEKYDQNGIIDKVKYVDKRAIKKWKKRLLKNEN